MHVVIIGNGIAGSTLARYLRKLGECQITMISDEKTYPFARTALMYVYMGHQREEDLLLYPKDFWAKNRIQLVSARVEEIDFDRKRLQLSSAQSLSYDKLVIACGSEPRKAGWPGEQLSGVQGLYHWQDLERLESTSKKGIDHAVIVGGGLIGVELAEMLHSSQIPVTYLVRESSFWRNQLPREESEMISRHLQLQGLRVEYGTTLKAIEGREKVTGVHTDEDKKIVCDFVGLCIGVQPNVAWLAQSGLTIRKGIVVNESLETNKKDVYAIGDCAELDSPKKGRRAIEAVWYTGKLMGATLAHLLHGKALAYHPGIWFNSAKFFDLEYQMYGAIATEDRAGVGTWYREHQNKQFAFRMDYDLEQNTVLGFNALGVRLNHAYCHKVLEEQANLDNVLKNIDSLCFEPEFSSARLKKWLLA